MNEARATWSRRTMMLGTLAGLAVLLTGCHAHRHYGGHHHGHHKHFGGHGSGRRHFRRHGGGHRRRRHW